MIVKGKRMTRGVCKSCNKVDDTIGLDDWFRDPWPVCKDCGTRLSSVKYKKSNYNNKTRKKKKKKRNLYDEMYLEKRYAERYGDPCAFLLGELL